MAQAAREAAGARRQLGFPQQKLTVGLPLHAPDGIAVQVYDAGNDTVGVVIVFGDLNPAKLPPKHDQTVSWGQLGDDYPWVIEGLAIADILTLNIAPAIILDLGILTDTYDAPLAEAAGQPEHRDAGGDQRAAPTPASGCRRTTRSPSRSTAG